MMPLSGDVPTSRAATLCRRVIAGGRLDALYDDRAYTSQDLMP
jgi:hypothetical protein